MVITVLWLFWVGIVSVHQYARAQSVARFLQAQGIDPSRFIVVGNGQDKPVADNNTDEGKAQNPRTGVFFKVVN